MSFSPALRQSHDLAARNFPLPGVLSDADVISNAPILHAHLLGAVRYQKMLKSEQILGETAVTADDMDSSEEIVANARIGLNASCLGRVLPGVGNAATVMALNQIVISLQQIQADIGLMQGVQAQMQADIGHMRGDINEVTWGLSNKEARDINARTLDTHEAIVPLRRMADGLSPVHGTFPATRGEFLALVRPGCDVLLQFYFGIVNNNQGLRAKKIMLGNHLGIRGL